MFKIQKLSLFWWEHKNITDFSLHILCLSPARFCGILGCSRPHSGWIFLWNLSSWLPQRLGLLPSADFSCLLLFFFAWVFLFIRDPQLSETSQNTFGGSKLSDWPRSLAQPHPWCLWVNKKEFISSKIWLCHFLLLAGIC